MSIQQPSPPFAASPFPFPPMPTPEALLQRARSHNTGDRSWQAWKESEAEAVLELARDAPRLTLLDMSFAGDLNLVYGISMPVPRWPDAQGRLQFATRALFHLNYQEVWRWDPPPGWMVCGLLEPGDLFLPAAGPGLHAPICLGKLAASTPVVECIFLAYHAVALQTVVLDETDPHGVVNPQACDYYRRHPEYLPLTHSGLRHEWNPNDLPTHA